MLWDLNRRNNQSSSFVNTDYRLGRREGAGLQSPPGYCSVKITELQLELRACPVKMIKSESRKKFEFCQSKHYKSWNPDYLAEYSR